ncbi:CD63 antigen [Frankliniella fusca]|uniref:Tetraspanin n=2 Tax=Arthropoda TaxID=6656 RepID=A0AAE1I0P5_9NEOP|nr:CD63 antigen [Frankliniella fusca]
MTVADDLGIGMRCIKYLLVAFNFLFAISGLLLVLTAIMVAGPLSQLMPLLERSFLSPGILLGVAGGAVIVVSCFGIWGAIRQSTALVTLFSFLLSLLLLLELGAAISAFLMQNGLRHILTQNIFHAMKNYDSDPATRHAIDRLQYGLRCCGYDSPTNWKEIPGHETYVPMSCCFDFPEVNNGSYAQMCPVELVESVHLEGCVNQFSLFILRGSAFIASTAVVTAFTQFLGVLFACTLGRSIRQQKTLRELRRTQLRNNLINSYSPLDTKPMPPITITY